MQTSKNGVTVGIEHFEPDRCKHDLIASGIGPDKWISGEKSVNYRKLRRPRAQRMADDMARRAWDLNGESIKYNDDGLLVDGQHRLLASVLSGCSFWSAVVHGIKTHSNIDTGSARTLANELQHRNVPNARYVASVVKLVSGAEEGQLRAALTRTWGTRSKLLQCFEKHPNIVDFVREADGARKSTFAAAIAYIGSMGEWFDLPEYWISRLKTGADLRHDDPVFVLREQLMSEKLQTNIDRRRVPLFAKMIKSWNCLVDGLPVSTNDIRWFNSGPAREPFPDIICISEVDWKAQCGSPDRSRTLFDTAT